MKTVLEILDEIGSNGSRLFKESVLEENKGNEDLKKVFFLTHDSQTNFYTRYIPELDIWGRDAGDMTLGQALQSIEDNLVSRKITGNAAKDYLDSLFRKLYTSDAEVIRRMLLRDLRIGATRSTANKIWEGLIPKQEFMLCSSEFDEDEITFPAFSQLKADGTRAKLVWNGVNATLFSRNGNEIETLGVFDETCLKNLGADPISLDGELVCFVDGHPMDRKTGNGIVNKCVKGTVVLSEAQFLHLQVWDVEMKGVPYCERFDLISELFTDYENISVIETRIVDSYQDALQHFKEKRREGLEGTIVKSFAGVWNPKRVKYQAKFKAMYEGDFKVTGWEYGSGKNSDKVGNLKCETSDGLVKFNVGIFKDFPSDIREKWLKECPPIVTVRYNERIKSKGREDGVESLFLPRVILERWDKSTCDSREDLIKMEEATLK